MALLELLVRQKQIIADDIYQFELTRPDRRDLPPFSPGSHVTVHTPSGQNRRYSLCNDPVERDRYVLAVKREEGGRGGSRSMADDVSVGSTLVIDPPGNDFPMSSIKPNRWIFIAGGIGITPIRAMMLDLARKGHRNFSLYYLTRTPSAAAFREEFLAPDYAGKAVIHHDGGDSSKAFDLWPVLEEQAGAHLYCCGPRGLMDAVRDMSGHWSDGSVHFEDFNAATAKGESNFPFEVVLARSGERLVVPSDRTILDVLRESGHSHPSSCESGSCGTCLTKFLSGDVDHRDVVLTGEERKNSIMICVSRARSGALTLDL